MSSSIHIVQQVPAWWLALVAFLQGSILLCWFPFIILIALVCIVAMKKPSKHRQID
ncbi:hypothetical protein [Dictyobacter aurantiacus]|uniref:Uncharacterized protein n=1 Tax=Dictyobacter aurantiacus TaxID=1936993 RepID=A0A401ZBI9_9CHLR|nr:hypothetical protein [Dictyobacter aurantiacus]GCE04235.1 hypothetical protein KDAU_15640 [Dictyobacter aurantiacus]